MGVVKSGTCTILLVAAVMCFLEAGLNFVSPAAPRAPPVGQILAESDSMPSTANAGQQRSGGWGTSMAAITIGAHFGLLLARSASRTISHAEAKEKAEKKAPAKYVESAVDQKLFENVFHTYTVEYLKGPMFWAPEKVNIKKVTDKQGNIILTDDFKTWSSNELAFLSMISLAIGTYGYLNWEYFDPQWAKPYLGENWNYSYIIEVWVGMPLSFASHIACYVQKKNGK